MPAPTRIEYFESLRRKPWLRRRWYWALVSANGLVVADGAEDYISEANVLRAIEDNINSKFKTPLPVSRRA